MASYNALLDIHVPLMGENRVVGVEGADEIVVKYLHRSARGINQWAAVKQTNN